MSFRAFGFALCLVVFALPAAFAEEIVEAADHLFQWEALTFECSTCGALDLETCEVFLSGEHVLVPCEKTTLLLLQETLQRAKVKQWNEQHPSARELLLFALSNRTALDLRRLALELLIATEQGRELLSANIALISALSEPWRAEFLERASTVLGIRPIISDRESTPEQSIESKAFTVQNAGALPQVKQTLLEPESRTLTHDSRLRTYTGDLRTYAGLLAFGLGFAALSRLLRRRFLVQRPKLLHAERVELRELQIFFKLKRSYSRDELKAQYRKLARGVHPDLNQGRSEDFIRLSERYQRAEHLLMKASAGGKG